MTNIHTNPSLRHDFVFLFEVVDGNPNGDPDAGNLPRRDPLTRQGLVTDVCIKHKVREWVAEYHFEAGQREVYIRSGAILNQQHRRIYDAKGLNSTGSKQDRSTIISARQAMCTTFWDVRMFGAVMNTRVNAGQVRGPLQLTLGRSIDEVRVINLSLTRCAVTIEEDAEVKVGADGKMKGGKEGTMADKFIIPYGLYLMYGFYSPAWAQKSGVSADDLDIFWQALDQMWSYDRSETRGRMSCRGLYVFSHNSPTGNAKAEQLFGRINARLRAEVQYPGNFEDYEVIVDDADLPEGVTLTRLVV